MYIMQKVPWIIQGTENSRDGFHAGSRRLRASIITYIHKSINDITERFLIVLTDWNSNCLKSLAFIFQVNSWAYKNAVT